MRILVTGATGFIGSHLTERLTKEGHKVKALIRNSESENKARKETINLLERLNVEICFGNLLDKNSLKNAVKNVDVIFHLAAIARPMAIPKKAYFKINEEGTKNLLEEACKNKKIKKIVIMSSVSAVGTARNGVAVNEKTECNPVDTYGWSKLAGEKVAFSYFKEYKLPIVLLRPPMVFGPRDFEMLKLFKTISKGIFPIRSNNKGMEFLYVENLVEACLCALKEGKNGEIYNISNGEHYSINDIIHAVEKANNKKISSLRFPNWSFVIAGYFIELLSKILRIHPPFKHDTVTWMTKKLWYSDISKAKKELKYNPEITLEEGVRRTIDYYKEKNLI